MSHAHPTVARRSLVVVLALGLALPVFAETVKPMTMDMTDAAAASPATKAYQAAMDAMMANMTIPYSDNPDVDFIRSMIPHHQGAVAMAKVALEHGKDPDVRKLAEGVIAAQEAEIKWMTEWLAKNGG
jgi:uncharacterized protein (DUF305 family)